MYAIKYIPYEQNFQMNIIDPNKIYILYHVLFLWWAFFKEADNV